MFVSRARSKRLRSPASYMTAAVTIKFGRSGRLTVDVIQTAIYWGRVYELIQSVYERAERSDQNVLYEMDPEVMSVNIGAGGRHQNHIASSVLYLPYSYKPLRSVRQGSSFGIIGGLPNALTKELQNRRAMVLS